MAEGNVKEKVGDAITRAKRRVGVEAPSAADAEGRVGIVRGALRAFGAGEIDDFIDALEENVQWEAPRGQNFPGSASHSGRDEVRDGFVAAVKRTYGTFGFRPDSFLEVDDENAVVAIGRFEGEGLDGGAVDTPGVQLWELKGKAVTRVCIFADSAAFPAVVTEEKRREWEEQEKQEQEDDSGSDGSEEGEGKGEGSAESENTSEGKGTGESSAESDDTSEGKGKDEPSAESGDTSEGERR